MKPRIYLKNGIYHLIARGNNQQNIFLKKQDFERFLLKMEIYTKKYSVKIISYCLMKNHIHLLIEQLTELPISKFMQALTVGYAMYFNKKYKRSGHLFQGRFHFSQITTEEYLIHLSRYIHLNPVAAKIVGKPEDYSWSSYKEYLGLEETPWVKKEVVLEFFKKTKTVADYKEFVNSQIPEAIERQIQKLTLE